MDSENTAAYNIDVGDCLITDNQLTGEIVYSDHTLAMDNCTLTHNITPAQHVIRVSGDAVALTNSIVDQNQDTFDFAGNNNSASRTMLFLLTNHSDPTLPPNPTLTVGNPHFVNPDQLNYHLQPDSIGLDAAIADSRSLDLDGYARDVDLPLVPNFQFPGHTAIRDLGAYELQLFQLPPPPPPPGCEQSDTIFCNGFE